MLLRLRSVLSHSFLIFSLFYYCFGLSARVLGSSDAYWIDEFLTIDENRWQYFNESGVDLFESLGEILFTNVHYDRAAFIQNNTELPAGDISIEISFRYISFGFGSGIAINDAKVPVRIVNNDPNSDDWIFFIWPTKQDEYKIFSIPCLNNGGTCLAQDNVVATISGNDFYDKHLFKAKYHSAESTYDFYLDNFFIGTTVPTSRLPKYIWIGNPMVTQGTVFANFYVDYVKIAKEGQEYIFPYYSQLDPLWAGEEYDHATSWAPSEAGIDRWGCALSSAAMMMKYYDVKTLLGEETTPANLNTWLKNQPDGFIRSGLLNWLAVARYAHESRLVGQAPKSLEYERRPYSPTLPITFPSILGETSHFVVAYDEDPDNYLLHDPLAGASQTVAKTHDYRSVGNYQESATDLSYLLIATDPGMQIELRDPSGAIVGASFREEAGEEVELWYYPKPESGEYQLAANGGTLTWYWYDENGKSEQTELACKEERLFRLYFDKTAAENGQVEEVVKEESFPDMIERLFREKEIRYRLVARTLTNYYEMYGRIPEKATRLRRQIKQATKVYTQVATRLKWMTSGAQTQILAAITKW